MRTQTTTTRYPGSGDATLASEARTSRPARRAQSGTRAGRLQSWKTTLFQSLGRELHALHCMQQERAFLATSHGLNYCDKTARASAALH